MRSAWRWLSVAHPIFIIPTRAANTPAHAYLALLEKAQMQVSMSAVGRCYDNAMKESFWATLKRECADHTFHDQSLGSAGHL